jgi:hypothetical protein
MCLRFSPRCGRAWRSSTTACGRGAWPGLERVWQLHLSESDGAENSDESFIANLVDDDKDVADWIKLRASDVAASA